mgnify:CR=1 FL=1
MDFIGKTEAGGAHGGGGVSEEFVESGGEVVEGYLAAGTGMGDEFDKIFLGVHRRAKENGHAEGGRFEDIMASNGGDEAAANDGQFRELVAAA